MKKIILFWLSLLLCSGMFGQNFTVNVSGTINTDCIGQGCFYNGPTILINEVMLSPSSYDGSMVGSAYYTNGGGEWIELYNPHKCDSVDISCYFLGNNAYDNTYQYGDWGGGFALPPGTVVPPQGFCMVRGSRAAPVPDSLLVQNGGNVVEVVINERYCMDVGGGRLWFPNAGGWFAFYDANGVPQDAISWCSATNSCMSCPPCTPVSECGFTGTLASYDEIPADRRTIITTVNPQFYLGQSFRRVPDGGNWVSTASTPTYATCNAQCADPPLIYCNAIAVATPQGGTPPYTYQWSDQAGQITDTAFGLCAGTYYVTVTDANAQTAVGEVTIVNYEPPVSHSSYTHCLSDSSAVLAGVPLGGTYTGGFVDNNQNFYFNDSAAVYAMAYTVSDTNGCTATANFTITVNPEYNLQFYDTICQNDAYNRYGFTLTSTQTATPGPMQLQSIYQTVNQCDSIVNLELFIRPTHHITLNETICEGTDFDTLGFHFPAADQHPGLFQEIHAHTNQFGCDSIVTLNLQVVPIYDIHMTEDLCQGIIYNNYGFQLNPDTMELGEHVFIHQGMSSGGCDSTFTLTVNVLPISETFFYDTVCQFEEYNHHGFLLEYPGTSIVGDFEYVKIVQNVYGCDSTVTLYLAVTGNPQVDFLSNPERVLLSDGAEVQFINLTDVTGAYGGETFTWHWDFGDGNEENTMELGMSHTYDTWGSFLVTLSVESSRGCSTTASHYVYVDADLEFPNIITPNGDGVNDVFAIKNLNPDLPNVLTIYDRWGKRVYEKKNYQTYIKDGILYNPEMGFSGEDSSDGVYYYSFHYDGFVRAVDFHSSLTIIR